MNLLRKHGPKGLLLLLILHFVAAPLSADIRWARYLVDGAYILMLLAAVNAGSRRISLRNPLVIAVGVSIALRPIAIQLDTPVMWGAVEIYTAALMFYIAVVILGNVTKDDKVTSDTIAGAAAVYILLAVAFASAHHSVALLGESQYAGVDMSEPHRDQTFQFYYYSVVTQTTLGYGDVLPRTNLARGLTMCQVVLGQLYLAVLLARLVATELAHRRSQNSD